MEREIHFRENWHIFWEILGEAELILKIWGAREISFRELRIFVMEIEKSMHYFQGSKEHGPLTPWGIISHCSGTGVHKTYKSFTLLRQR